MKTPKFSLALLGLVFMAQPVLALDKLGFEYGNSAGDAEIDRYGATATIDWSSRWLQSGSWYLGGYWEAGVNFWDSDPGRTGNDSLVDVYMMPVLRWQRDPASGFAPFLELGTGPWTFGQRDRGQGFRHRLFIWQPRWRRRAVGRRWPL
jgi:Lipid A 3-O-deacylase (PagL)